MPRGLQAFCKHEAAPETEVPGAASYLAPRDRGAWSARSAHDQNLTCGASRSAASSTRKYSRASAPVTRAVIVCGKRRM